MIFSLPTNNLQENPGIAGSYAKIWELVKTLEYKFGI